MDGIIGKIGIVGGLFHAFLGQHHNLQYIPTNTESLGADMNKK